MSNQNSVNAVADTLENRTTKMLDEFRGDQKKTEQSTWEDGVPKVPASQQTDEVESS
jgi:hypothetical protein